MELHRYGAGFNGDRMLRWGGSPPITQLSLRNCKMCEHARMCVCARVGLLVTLTVCMFMDDSLLLTWRSLEKHLDPRGEKNQQEKRSERWKQRKDASSTKQGRAFFASGCFWMHRGIRQRASLVGVTAGTNMPPGFAFDTIYHPCGKTNPGFLRNPCGAVQSCECFSRCCDILHLQMGHTCQFAALLFIEADFTK